MPKILDDIKISDIVSDDLKIQKLVIEKLYKFCFPTLVRMYINTPKDDLEDIFQEALTIVYFNVKTGKFKGDSALSTYLISISKNLHHSKVKKEIKKSGLKEDTVIDYNEVNKIVNVDLFIVLFERLKEDCQSLLKDYYYSGMSIKELRDQYNLGSDQAAKNKKYRCLKKLIEIIKENKIKLESFYLN